MPMHEVKNNIMLAEIQILFLEAIITELGRYPQWVLEWNELKDGLVDLTKDLTQAAKFFRASRRVVAHPFHLLSSRAAQQDLENETVLLSGGTELQPIEKHAIYFRIKNNRIAYTVQNLAGGMIIDGELIGLAVPNPFNLANLSALKKPILTALAKAYHIHPNTDEKDLLKQASETLHALNLYLPIVSNQVIAALKRLKQIVSTISSSSAGSKDKKAWDKQLALCNEKMNWIVTLDTKIAGFLSSAQKSLAANSNNEEQLTFNAIESYRGQMNDTQEAIIGVLDDVSALDDLKTRLVTGKAVQKFRVFHVYDNGYSYDLEQMNRRIDAIAHGSNQPLQVVDGISQWRNIMKSPALGVRQSVMVVGMPLVNIKVDSKHAGGVYHYNATQLLKPHQFLYTVSQSFNPSTKLYTIKNVRITNHYKFLIDLLFLAPPTKTFMAQIAKEINRLLGVKNTTSMALSVLPPVESKPSSKDGISKNPTSFRQIYEELAPFRSKSSTSEVAHMISEALIHSPQYLQEPLWLSLLDAAVEKFPVAVLTLINQYAAAPATVMTRAIQRSLANEAGTALGYALDYDGSLAPKPVANPRDQLGALFTSNPNLINKMIKDIDAIHKAEPGKRIIVRLLIGSNRQSLNIDESNRELNSNGSPLEALELLKDHVRQLVQKKYGLKDKDALNDFIDIQVDKYRMVGVMNEPVRRKPATHSDHSEERHSIDEWAFEAKKRQMILGLMHHFAKYFFSKKAHLKFFDDVQKILDAINTLYKSKMGRFLIPSNVTLMTYLYDSWEAGQLVTLLEAIKGTGPINFDISGDLYNFARTYCPEAFGGGLVPNILHPGADIVKDEVTGRVEVRDWSSPESADYPRFFMKPKDVDDTIDTRVLDARKSKGLVASPVG